MSTSEAGSKIQYVNLVILLAILVLLVIGHLGGSQTTAPDSIVVKPSDAQYEKIKESPISFIVDKSGTVVPVNIKGDTGEKCSRKPRKGEPQCNAFKGKKEVLNVDSVGLLEVKGSFEYIVVIDGKLYQFCYDDNFNPISCN